MGQLIGMIWTFLNGFTIPFLGVTPAVLIVTIIVINLSLSLLRILLGLGSGAGSFLARTNRRNSKRIDK